MPEPSAFALLLLGSGGLLGSSIVPLVRQYKRAKKIEAPDPPTLLKLLPTIDKMKQLKESGIISEKDYHEFTKTLIEKAIDESEHSENASSAARALEDKV